MLKFPYNFGLNLNWIIVIHSLLKYYFMSIQCLIYPTLDVDPQWVKFAAPAA